MKSELVTPTHLARKAVVYIRQSTPHQVVSNQESLRLQYALRQRARELGWHDADIDVIDVDLGRSGASATQRSGFKELVGRVGLSEVGEKADHLGLVQRFEDGSAGCARYRPAWFPCSAGYRWVFATDGRRLRRALSDIESPPARADRTQNQVVDLFTWAQQGVASPCRSRRG